MHDWKLLKPGKNIDVVVNTSSFGMKNTDVLSINSSKLKKETLILDIIYEPRETEFLKQLKKRKFKTHNGIGMLIRQAAESFNFWFNISLKEDIEKMLENNRKQMIKIAILEKNYPQKNHDIQDIKAAKI